MFDEALIYNDFLRLKETKTALLCYFSTENCNVCKVLKTKVFELIEAEFPNVTAVFISSEKFPEIAAQNQVFASPTILVFFEGKEFVRKSRNIGIDELRQALQRPYDLIFSV